MEPASLRILIVDDEDSIQRSLRAFLEDEGFEVATAVSGEDGLEALSHTPCDAAVVDIRLPGMDGNLFIERAHELCPAMRFLVYTGSVGYSPPASIQSAGILDSCIFKKPIRDMSVLATALKDLLGKR
jgi:CheY-like chemotaxis protein